MLDRFSVLIKTSQQFFEKADFSEKPFCIKSINQSINQYINQSMLLFYEPAHNIDTDISDLRFWRRILLKDTIKMNE